MVAGVFRPVLPLMLLPLLLSACGATARPTAVAPVAAVKASPAIARALALAEEAHPLEGPLTARTVLAYGHAVAKLIDAKMMFTSLVGTRIGVDGEPVRGGEWQLSYVGTEAVAPKGTRNNPYNPIHRRVTVIVPTTGKPRVDVVEAEGMPLGQCFYEAPMPSVDSAAAIERVRGLRPEEPAQGGYRLQLQGLMNANHFQELVWKIGRATQGADKPLLLNAHTGEPILK